MSRAIHGTRPDTHGSRTMTVTPTTDSEAGPSISSPPSREETPEVGVLHLRGGPARRQRVMWASDTIDNEGMGKKKSKICCIYHKPRRFDESSSESESGSDDECCDAPQSAQRARPLGGADVVEQSSESESDGGGGDGRARPARRPRRKVHSHSHGDKANKYDAQPRATSKNKA